MADLVLPVTPGTLPAGACPTDYQSMLNLFASFMSVTFPTSTGNLVVSSTTPADTTATWLRLDSLGRPVGVYYFASGAWLSPHPLVPGVTMIWTTTLPNLNTFDGGDALALSAISGNMWEEVTSLRAKIPIGVGTLPSGLALAVADTGGEEKHTLLQAELPSFTAQPGLVADSGTDKVMNSANGTGSTVNGVGLGVSGVGNRPKVITEAITFGSNTPHNTMPPYAAVYFLRRTSRLFYRV